MSTKLKLLGVDVASFGDAHGATEGCHELTFADPIAGVYKKIVIAPDKDKLLGGILVGDATDYGTLHQWMASSTDLPLHPERPDSPRPQEREAAARRGGNRRRFARSATATT